MIVWAVAMSAAGFAAEMPPPLKEQPGDVLLASGDEVIEVPAAESKKLLAESSSYRPASWVDLVNYNMAAELAFKRRRLLHVLAAFAPLALFIVAHRAWQWAKKVVEAAAAAEEAGLPEADVLGEAAPEPESTAQREADDGTDARSDRKDGAGARREGSAAMPHNAKLAPVVAAVKSQPRGRRGSRHRLG
jgi:hypothetical protein